MFMEQTETSSRQLNILVYTKIEFKSKLQKVRIISIAIEVEVLRLNENLEDIMDYLSDCEESDKYTFIQR